MQTIFANPAIGTWMLIFFFALFVLIAIWAFRPENKKKMEQHGKIPLEENGR
ncbi:MAG: cbb3-type cytochrome c oxidase subunit 3 [Alphaproteobacteria bacterium]|nr:MAG: cbb3-type cytochrome c oxidase subunit 3 [Alphaproteobacteria bacterium]